MSENALERLMKESQLLDNEPKYSLDEMVESDEETFLEKMSDTASSSLKQKLQPETLEDEEEIEIEETKKEVDEPEKVEIEKVEIEKVEKPEIKKAKKSIKNKKDKGNKLDEFMNSLANECIDIMIQSGVTIHNFNAEQMNIIWDYIKSRI